MHGRSPGAPSRGPGSGGDRCRRRSGCRCARRHRPRRPWTRSRSRVPGRRREPRSRSRRRSARPFRCPAREARSDSRLAAAARSSPASSTPATLTPPRTFEPAATPTAADAAASRRIPIARVAPNPISIERRAGRVDIGRMMRRERVAVVMGGRGGRRSSARRRCTVLRLHPARAGSRRASPLARVASDADRSLGERAVRRRRSRGLSPLRCPLSSGPSGDPLVYSRLRRRASRA